MILGLLILAGRARMLRNISKPSMVKGTKGFSYTGHAGEGSQTGAEAAKAAEEA